MNRFEDANEKCSVLLRTALSDSVVRQCSVFDPFLPHSGLGGQCFTKPPHSRGALIKKT